MAERVRLLINTDTIQRNWKRAVDSGDEYAAKCHPFLQIGSIPRAEFEELERNSVPDTTMGDGWMIEVENR